MQAQGNRIVQWSEKNGIERQEKSDWNSYQYRENI